MKFVQCALCGLLLTLPAAAQMTPAAPASNPPSQMASPKPMPLSTPDGDTVKGPEHPITLDQMKELYALMGYQKLFDDTRAQTINVQKTRMPFIPQDVWDDLDSSSKKVDYPTAFLAVYQKYVSTEDAAKLIDFAKTPAGKAYFENLPVINRETTAAIAKQQQDVSRDVQGRHKDELQAAFKKYQDEQQQKAPKPAAAPAGGSSSASPSTAKPATPPAATTPAPATPSTPPANPPNN